MRQSEIRKVILPEYSAAPVSPSRWRRGGFFALQLLAAALYGFAAVALPPELLVILIAPILICLLLVLWLMPDRGVFPFRAIERSYGVTFFLMLTWPNYIAVVLPGLPWVTPTRIALFITTFLFQYSISTSGPLRRHLVNVALSSPLLWIFFLLWQMSMFTSLPFSHAIGESIKGIFDNELRLTQVFFLGCLVFAKRGGPTWTIRWMLTLAFVASIDGFIELRLGYPPWANSIPSFMKIDATMLGDILSSQARSDDGLYRVRGPYVNSLVFSEFLAACFPFIIHWLFTGRSILLRTTMGVLWIVILGAMVITQSRLGLIGALIAVGVYVPLWAYRQWRADRTSILGPALLFGTPVAAVALMGVVFSSHTLTMRILGGGAQAASDEGRTIQRNMAIPKFLTHPLGYGINQAAGVLGFTTPDGRITVDNYYINVFLDLGVPGAIGFYGMFIVAATLGIGIYLKTDDRENELAGPLGIVCLNFVILKWVLSQEQNHSLIFLLMGMLMAIRARDRQLCDADSLFSSANVTNNAFRHLTFARPR